MIISVSSQIILLSPPGNKNQIEKMASEDDIVELLYKSGKIVLSSQTVRTTTVSDLHILRGSGSGRGAGENAPIPPPPPAEHQNVFIMEDEMAAWLHHHNHEDDLYSSFVNASQPRNLISQPPTQVQRAQNFANFANFARLRANIITGAGPATTESCLTPATITSTFAVPSLSWKAIETVTCTSSSGVCMAEAATETDHRKRKEREETEGNEEEGGGSTSRKRSRAAEMHNLSERRRRERINDRLRALQEVIPRCNKSDKASMLEDAVEYIKSLQMQIQMMSVGGGVMPMMYTPDMQRLMPQTVMGMNRPPFIPFPGAPPFPRQAHMPPRYPFQASDPVWNQAQFPGYMNPYSQFVGLEQMQQPSTFHNPITSQVNVSQASASKAPDDQENQPTG